MYSVNINQKKTEMPVLKFDKVNIRAREASSDKEGDYKVLKELSQFEGKTK